jgi:rod shape-determining protein MreC
MHDTAQNLSRQKSKSGLSAIVVLTLSVLCLLFLVFSFFRPQFLKESRLFLSDSLTPVINFIHTPFQSIRNAFHALTHFAELSEENEKLKLQKQQLLQWRQLALKLEAENISLKEFLRFVPDNKAEFVTASVIFSNITDGRSLMISIDPAQKIQKGNLVLGKNGVIGKIGEIGEKHARVLLINDANSRIPVRVEGKNISALVAGDLKGDLKLLYVPQGVFLSPNDRLLTSSEGQIIPQGYFLGTIGNIQDDQIEVIPSSPLESIDFVIVIVQTVDAAI